MHTKTFLGLLVAMVLAGCDLNQPRVYFDPGKNLLYVDSAANPEYRIQSAEIYSENEIENAMPPGDTAMDRKQFSFDRYVDSTGVHHFSINVYLKKYPQSFIVYYGEVKDTSRAIIELTQTDM